MHLVEAAKAVIDAGFPVIVDAAFLKTEQRDLFQKLAAECGVKFLIVDFQASEEELCRRIRLRQSDASEATIEVLQQQKQSAQPLSVEEQNYIITINTESGNALNILLEHIGGLLQ
jgi:hypothetical protein